MKNVAAIVAMIVITIISSPSLADQSLDVGAEIDVRFVTLPDAPSFTGKGMGSLIVTDAEKKRAYVDGASIPDIVFESNDMTVIAKGIPGTKPIVDWSKFPVITFRELDLRVTAYRAEISKITSETSPVIDIVLSDINLSTSEIEVEGWEDAGYIDAEAMEAQLVGRAILPNYDHAEYMEWLAGEPILITLRIRMKNPYSK